MVTTKLASYPRRFNCASLFVKISVVKTRFASQLTDDLYRFNNFEEAVEDHHSVEISDSFKGHSHQVDGHSGNNNRGNLTNIILNAAAAYLSKRVNQRPTFTSDNAANLDSSERTDIAMCKDYNKVFKSSEDAKRQWMQCAEEMNESAQRENKYPGSV